MKRRLGGHGYQVGAKLTVVVEAESMIIVGHCIIPLRDLYILAQLFGWDY